MEDRDPNLSLITLRKNGLNTPIKSRDWKKGKKNMNQYAVYKGHVLG